MNSNARKMTDRLLDKLTDLATGIIGKVFKDPPSALNSREKVAQLVNYCLFGVLTTIVSFVTYLLFAALLRLNSYGGDVGNLPVLSMFKLLLGIEVSGVENIENAASYAGLGLLCQLLSWICAVLFAFYTNKIFVFRSEESGEAALKELGKFALARVLSFILIEIFVYLALMALMGHLPAKIVVTVLVVIFNYFASKFAVFRKKQEKA